MDITNSKHSELELIEKEREFRGIFENAGAGIAIVTLKGEFTLVNNRFCEMFGYNQSQLQAMCLPDLVHPEDIDLFRENQEKVFSGESDSYGLRKRCFRQDGSLIWINCSFSCVCTEQTQQSAYCIGIFQDVTKEVLAMNNLEQEQKNKDAFLSLLGHELRNPLAAVINGNRALQTLCTDGDRQKLVALIDRQSRHMRQLINDLLDISRMTKGFIKIRKEQISLYELLVEVKESHQHSLDQKHIRLDLDLPEQSLHIHADPDRLLQVMNNLLENALRYSDEHGSIHIKVLQEGDKIKIEVADDGVGFAKEKGDDLFTLYSSTETRLENKKGLGLGLPLVAHIVQLHGGSVSAKSEGVGRGATFTICLPMGKIIDPPSASTDKPYPKKITEETALTRRILLADDNEDLAKSIALGLKVLGHDVTTVADGLSAIKIAQSGSFDIGLVDIGLPGTNGIQVAREIHGQVPVIGVTGYTSLPKEDYEGLDYFVLLLIKPVTVSQLAQHVEKVLKHQEKSQTVGDKDVLKILVLDDNMLLGYALKLGLKCYGHTVFVASSAAGAPSAPESYDAIIWGVGSAEKNIAFDSIDKDHVSLRIAITDSNNSTRVENLEATGFDAVVKRPVEAEELLQLFRSLKG